MEQGRKTGKERQTLRLLPSQLVLEANSAQSCGGTLEDTAERALQLFQQVAGARGTYRPASLPSLLGGYVLRALFPWSVQLAVLEITLRGRDTERQLEFCQNTPDQKGLEGGGGSTWAIPTRV